MYYSGAPLGEMIFDFEEIEMDKEKDKDASPRPPPHLPLLEQPALARPLRPGKSRGKGLPESFPGLRPASLPTTPAFRPLRSPPGVDSSHSAMLSLPYSPRRGGRINGMRSPPVDAKENADKDPTYDNRGKWRLLNVLSRAE